MQTKDPMLRVLLIEDDELLGEGVCAGLSGKGWDVEWARDGVSGHRRLLRERFDAVLLDLQLPGKSGMGLLREVRASGLDVPILIVTARDAVEDRVEGLEAGADDYVIKPFDLHEIAARIRAVCRRSEGAAGGELIHHGDLVLDRAARAVKRGGMAVALPRRELLLFEALLENRGRVLTLDQLQDRLYGWNDGVESNAVAVHIHNLRRKLGHQVIRTVRGIGYTIPKDSA